jgi:AcrR family transcriptional regulator
MNNHTDQLPHAVQIAWLLAEQATNDSRKMSAFKIATAAIALADAEGLDAVTIRAVAEKVGLTPMGVYRHFLSRDEMLISMFELAIEAPSDVSLDVSWQERLRTWSQSLFERYQAHPWSMDIPTIGMPMTPNHIAWVEQALDILAPTNLPLQHQLDCALLISGHAQQFARLITKNPQTPTSKASFAALLTKAENQAPRLVNALSQGILQSKDGPSFMSGIDIIIHGLEQESK